MKCKHNADSAVFTGQFCSISIQNPGLQPSERVFYFFVPRNCQTSCLFWHDLLYNKWAFNLFEQKVPASLPRRILLQLRCFKSFTTFENHWDFCRGVPGMFWKIRNDPLCCQCNFLQSDAFVLWDFLEIFHIIWDFTPKKCLLLTKKCLWWCVWTLSAHWNCQHFWSPTSVTILRPEKALLKLSTLCFSRSWIFGGAYCLLCRLNSGNKSAHIKVRVKSNFCWLRQLLYSFIFFGR